MEMGWKVVIGCCVRMLGMVGWEKVECSGY